ncbi:MAG: HlyD family type I secretion periplasmic adaptor subunit [Geminicoccaceae bacterium]|nr:HlyD family type I secretion periplasmic adaptor subunit [Geminicoccaceae bacterium]MCS7267635.1 HlyD family type I secretion periplasmic adaptor subunit [Geminicoccaceae bacterium]MCX7630976.1 HlyD family type I secretion periplasmic adaptor subunit [Geminicoccaceae bacterium]MDW8123193.1 HlyD family type I secretion periplasmic adaptor subunit [Geminicoccaceae bacterium]MDW8340147.1 HlyD family type I secretion periplasmic adaptor subunit [Geminicoccaceae bacterium]
MARQLPARTSRRPLDRELARMVAGAAAADRLRPHGLGHALLFSVVAFFAIFVVWASWARVAEITRGEGKVIPSRQVQVIQNLEGGILAEMLVREGQVVEQGQILLRIDNVRAESDYREKRARYMALLAAIARLQAEIDDTKLVFPPEVLAEARDVAEREQKLFLSRQENLEKEIEILRIQAQQRESELKELETKLAHYERSLELAREELRLAEPAARRGDMSQSVFLKLQREVNDLRGAVESTRAAILRVRTAIREAHQKVERAWSSFRSQAQEELTQKAAELAGIREIVLAGADRIRRTEVRSPVKGTVKQIKVTTIGGVIQPGQDIMEIVPLEDTLLVEAHIRPADIAFLRPGLPAKVKITAYDYSIYGGLDGEVEDISADTITNERGESFYRVRIRTVQNHLGTAEHPLLIIPGMTAQIDILTGEKTVMHYLLKPIIKARDRALTER